MRPPIFGALLACYLLFLPVPAILAQSSINSINQLPEQRRHAALLEKAQTHGVVPVILSVASPEISDKQGSDRFISPSEVALAQQKVIDLLEIRPVRQGNVKKYQHIPYLALQVTADELLTLIESPQVAYIQEDEHYATLLDESTEAIGAQAAWQYGGSGAGQTIAVVDTGVDRYHPFLDGKVTAEACFSSAYESTSSNFESLSLCPEGIERAYGEGAALHCDPAISGCGHGTRVAGIVAGHSEEFSGVAKDADILAIQVFSQFENYCGTESCVRSWVSDQVAALDYIYQKRDSLNISVVNLSLGGGHYTDEQTCDEVNPAMRILIDMLHEEGIAVIAAAGNSGLTDGLVSPACISNAISVGATTKEDNIATFSSSASFLDFWAPGQDIITSIPGGEFAASAGTSFSAPHVAGAWAILKASAPDASVEEILATFSDTGFLITDDRNDVTTSRIQVDLALQASQLPVDLVSFEVRVTDATAYLAWETASELNNAGFEVEHEVGGEFAAVGYVAGQGTVTEHTRYQHEVKGLAPGWHRFRLRQIDFDGTFSFSLEQRVFVEVDGSHYLGSAYPNPFNPQTQFSLTLATTQHVLVEVYNLIGKRVMTLADEQLEANERHLFTLDGANLPSGIYLIQTTGEQFVASRSVTLVK